MRSRTPRKSARGGRNTHGTSRSPATNTAGGLCSITAPSVPPITITRAVDLQQRREVAALEGLAAEDGGEAETKADEADAVHAG